MSKLIRRMFRNAVFARDNYRCRVCNEPAIDAHHIVDRSEMEDGGYLVANGISLCTKCHKLAEMFHRTGTPYPGLAPEDLHLIIRGRV